MRVINLPPENIEAYYKRVKEHFEIKMIHSALAGKADLGSTRSEKGYQLIAASTCRQIARALRCSEDKAEALSLSVGQFFPKYGMAGVEPIKEYIKKNNIDLDTDNLDVEYVEYTITERYMDLERDFDEKLRQYFRSEDSIMEVDIVRFVQDTIRQVKIAEKYYDGDPGDLLLNVTWEIRDLAKETGQLTPSKILEAYKEQIDAYEPPVLTEEQRQGVFDELDEYLHDFCENTGKAAIFNETREKAVLIYMKMAT